MNGIEILKLANLSRQIFLFIVKVSRHSANSRSSFNYILFKIKLKTFPNSAKFTDRYLV